jgi:CRISPR-associated endoribonuclease Cas6/Csy4 subtype I-F
MSAPLVYFIDVFLHGDLRDSFALKQVLAAVHSTNRQCGRQATNSYRLGIAFPFWIDPKFHATKMLGFGSTGPVVRVMSSSNEALNLLSQNASLLHLQSIGDTAFTPLAEVPSQINTWAAFRRASDAESLTPSHIRRLEKRVVARGASSIQSSAQDHAFKVQPSGYLKIPLKSESTNQTFKRCVRKFDFSEPSITQFEFDSWGLSKPTCRVPMF